jgi:hypothetical protein
VLRDAVGCLHTQGEKDRLDSMPSCGDCG